MAKIVSVAIICLVYASIAKGRLDESLITDEFRELLDNLHEKCTKEVDIEDEMIENTHNGEFPEDTNLKCYMKCVLSNSGAMGGDGTLDYTLVENDIPEGMREGIKNKFDQCVPQATNDDFCERAFEFFTCSYKVNAETYFLH